MKSVGRTTWVIAGGRIPLHSTGPEPELTSRDELFIMNTGDGHANVELTIYYADREPVAGYRLTVGARRVRRVRCNDLIDPEALRLDVDYGVVLESNVSIIVHFDRVDTTQPALARQGNVAFPVDT